MTTEILLFSIICHGVVMVAELDSKSIDHRGRGGSRPPLGTKKDKINFDNSKKIVIFVVESSLILLFYIWRVSDLD